MPGRNAGEEHAGTQGWRRPRQVAMPGETSGDARLPSAGGNKARFLLSADEHYVEGQRFTVLREEQLQVPRCKLNKKMVVRYRFTVLREVRQFQVSRCML